MFTKFVLFFFALSLAVVFAQDSSSIDVATFNIRFFPCNENGEMMKQYDIEMQYPPTGDPTDTTMLFRIIRDLDIEVLGVQEIVDPPLFGAMAKRHLGDQYEFIYEPSKGWQKVGILYNSEKVRLIGEPQIYNEVTIGRTDRLRPALRGYFKTIPDGFDFHVIVVHLKSGPRGYEERIKQWAEIDTLLTGLPAGAERDADIILLGDFNNTSKNRKDEFLPLMSRLGYYWTGSEDTLLFSEYWRPDWQVHEIEGSSIDQIFVSADAKIEYAENSLRVGGLCAERQQVYNGAFPEYYLKISDHCPVIATFRAFPDDD